MVTQFKAVFASFCRIYFHNNDRQRSLVLFLLKFLIEITQVFLGLKDIVIKTIESFRKFFDIISDLIAVLRSAVREVAVSLPETDLQLFDLDQLVDVIDLLLQSVDLIIRKFIILLYFITKIA